jgi:hypothetical protein
MISFPANEHKDYRHLCNEDIENVAIKLFSYCRANHWAGYDPYDALNSRILAAVPLLNFKAARLLMTQAVKRCPVNLRPLLLVPKTQNPKGIALFLSSIIRLSRAGMPQEGTEVTSLSNLLLATRTPGVRHSCWGYNFDWQTRGALVPKYSPNIICTSFAANALLDAFELSGDSSWLDVAANAGEFILEKLFWRDNDSQAYFCYTPLERSQIHNANLLGAALLCRIGRTLSLQKFIEPALEATRYSVRNQHEDGSWDYGEAPHQRWIDNFHTGYNLLALQRIRDYGRTADFDSATRKGFNFYLTHFFNDDGAPRYYHNSTYPLDIHCAAQSIITLVGFRQFSETSLALARQVLGWAMSNMWDSGGFFYFQKHPHYLVRTPFMRWSQAWMLLALATLIEDGGGTKGRDPADK